MTPDGTPRWFREALLRMPEHSDVEVDGCRIHVRSWGDADRPVVILVHGGSAHSGWWDHVGPLLAINHRVVALDLSGHGDSGWRQAYDLEQWAREVVAVAETFGAGPPVVVGHSMGGWVTVTAGVRYGEALDGVVIIDSPLNDQPPDEEWLRRRRRPTAVYPTRQEAIERFITLPAQDILLPYVRRHIAEESICAVDGGWTWKFDPATRGPRTPLRDLLAHLHCRAAFVRTEFGLVPPAMADEIDELLGHRVPIVELPTAGHHPMLDQPLPLVTVLRLLLAQWNVASAPAGDVVGSR